MAKSSPRKNSPSQRGSVKPEPRLKPPCAPMPRWQRVAPFAAITLVGLIAYCNSFTGAMLFDDLDSIVHNPTIQHLAPLTNVLKVPGRFGLTIEGRPMVNLSLALNYALNGLLGLEGLDVRSYHVANLAIHVLAAWLLFAILRRTFGLVACGLGGGTGFLACAAQPGKAVPPVRTVTATTRDTALALAAALLWAVHPVQTESVTYIVQRAEAMMGLMYLAVLYCAIRSDGCEKSPVWWWVPAVACCAAGMACKEVMVTAPLTVLLYDRIFLAGSFRQALKRRWPLYVGLAATWAVLAMVLVPGRGGTAGALAKMTWLEYALTQPGVILHYLRLAIWPWPLVLDYGWPVARTWPEIVLPALGVVALLAVTLWALFRRPVLGFVGAWFFLILAPSSSVYPLNDMAFEHRMYLPLAAVMTLAVLTGDWLWRRIVARFAREGVQPSRLLQLVPVAAVLLVVVMYAGLTLRRNTDYASPRRMWEDVAAKAPNNARAQVDVGAMWFMDGRAQEAFDAFNRAIALRPNFFDAYLDRAGVYSLWGQTDAALADYTKAIALKPQDPRGHCFRGVFLKDKLGRFNDAVADFDQAVRLFPTYDEAYAQRALAYQALGKFDQAQADYDRAIELRPKDAGLYYNRAHLFLQRSEFTRALEDCNATVHLAPQNPQAYELRATAYYVMGQYEKAKADAETCVRLGGQPKPEFLRGRP